MFCLFKEAQISLRAEVSHNIDMLMLFIGIILKYYVLKFILSSNFIKLRFIILNISHFKNIYS